MCASSGTRERASNAALLLRTRLSGIVVSGLWLDWLPEAVVLLSEAILLPEGPRLLLAVQLSGGRPDAAAADRSWLIRAPQQHVLLVLRGVVDELPLVVGLFLVVNPDRLLFIQARDPDNGASSEGLVAGTVLPENGTAARLAAGQSVWLRTASTLLVASESALQISVAARIAGDEAGGHAFGVASLA